MSVDPQDAVAGPCTRGVAARAPLTQLDRFRPGRTAELLERIPPESLGVIESTSALGWVPVAHERYVAQAVFEVLGDDDAIAYFRWLVTRHLVHTPLFRPVMTQVRRLFGIDAGKLLGVVPKPFGLLFRDFGDVVPSDRGPRWAELELRGAAPIVLETPWYRESWRGAFASVFDIALTDGEVELSIDRDAARLCYRLSW